MPVPVIRCAGRGEACCWTVDAEDVNDSNDILSKFGIRPQFKRVVTRRRRDGARDGGYVCVAIHSVYVGL